MENPQFSSSVDQIRAFNRYYTHKIGVLNKGLLETNYSLTKARILFELGQQEFITATEICARLHLDPAYLSRTLSSFHKKGLVRQVPSPQDARQRLVELTSKGKQEYEDLTLRSRTANKSMIKDLSIEQQYQLLQSMKRIEQILSPEKASSYPYLIRTHQCGDIGWIVQQHGLIYAKEYGFDEHFEALVADIMADFIQNQKPDRECLWIAEHNGKAIGSVMIVDAGQEVAKLRVLIVHPDARGKGVAKKLVDTCIQFSKQKGYKKITLWTQQQLKSARHIYHKAGFVIVKETANYQFGQNSIDETWELDLLS